MRRVLNKWKDNLYYLLVEKNDAIGQEYHRYVDTHQEEHKQQRLRSWKLLLRLNWQYRVLKKEPSVVSTTKRKLPYLNGSESLLQKRSAPHQFVKSLLQYDVISFDIFDTLILRPLSDPKDIFMIVGEKLDYLDFYRIRRDCERTVRTRLREENGYGDITIYEIYEEVEKVTGIPQEVGIQAELETEIDLCFANPYMKRVFNILKCQNKRIIAVSDMYLPKSLMKKLLNACGYDYVEDIFVSCDYRLAKRDGSLYEVVKEQLGREAKIIHIGDNINSDITMAQKCGLETSFYRNVNSIGRKYRVEGMSPLIGSAYAGIVNTTLHNGLNKFSPQYEYGFIYGGLYVLGFVNWVHEHAVLHGITKVLFLARDGYVYKRVYDMLFEDIPSEYVYWSRMASIKYIPKRSKEDFFHKTTTRITSLQQKITIAMMLRSIGLEKLNKSLIQYGLNPDDLVTQNNKNKIDDFLLQEWEHIQEIYEDGRKILKELFSSILKGHKRVSVVDVGWEGHGPLGIKHLIEKEWDMKCQVYCLLSGKSSFPPQKNIANSFGFMEAYLFSCTHNVNLYNSHRSQKNVRTLFFEMFTQAPHPAISEFCTASKSCYKFQFGIAEVENYPTILSITNGIIDFCQLYSQAFKKYPYFLKISGYDAYLPFQMICRNLKFLQRYLGHLKNQRIIGKFKEDELYENELYISHLQILKEEYKL